ncbi:MAG: 50S ribosomal protein L6 [Candidatus Pacearchaeota archaeon]|nr:50S ribosomal protein L6 [Candidatus Pacearchaeota archaeon]
MKKELSQRIEIPEGVNVTIEGARVVAEGKEGKNEREFNLASLDLKKKDNAIVIGSKKSSKNEKRRMNTIAAHIKNLIQGVQEKFEYKLKICFSHFPITVEAKGNEALIKNFLGEKTPRKAKIPSYDNHIFFKDVITVTASNIETAGQAAANLETATRISNKDRRVFQDGIFITSKCGEEI